MLFRSCAGAALYRKAVFEKIGDFDENHFAYLEDIDVGYDLSLDSEQLGEDGCVELIRKILPLFI